MTILVHIIYTMIVDYNENDPKVLGYLYNILLLLLWW